MQWWPCFIIYQFWHEQVYVLNIIRIRHARWKYMCILNVDKCSKVPSALSHINLWSHINLTSTRNINIWMWRFPHLTPIKHASKCLDFCVSICNPLIISEVEHFSHVQEISLYFHFCKLFKRILCSFLNWTIHFFS